MFSEIVLVVKKLPNSGGLLIDAESKIRHARDGFEDDGIMSRGCRIVAPGKRSMIGHQHRRNRNWIHAFKSAHDGVPGIFFIP